MINVNWMLFNELHERTDEFTIRAEELSGNYYADLQIMKEERDAYGHICSAYGKQDEEKQKAEFDYALSHQYRALYDSMDWLSVVYRMQINKVYKQKKKKVEKNVLYDLKKMSEQIARYRKEKDVIHDSTSKERAITLGISAYIEVLNKLDEIYDKLLKA